MTRSVSTKRPKRGSRVLFSGLVSPAHVGGTAAIQRRTGGVWKTVKNATLAASTATSSAYSARVRVRSTGTYRVRVEGDGAHDAGNEQPRQAHGSLTIRGLGHRASNPGAMSAIPSWIGTQVGDRVGRAVGSVCDVYYDEASSRAAWLLVDLRERLRTRPHRRRARAGATASSLRTTAS